MMGAWGTAIFSDDVAADVRDHFTDLVSEGLEPGSATKRLVHESKDILEDDDDAVVFWIALAATQSKLGRLTRQVRDKAVRSIDQGEDLPRWQECSTSEINQRKKHLAKLRLRLLGPHPKPKKLR